MFASTVLSPAMLRVTSAVSAIVRKFLMLAGFVFILGFASLIGGQVSLPDALQPFLSSTADAAEAEDGDEAESSIEPAAVQATTLTKPMRRALDYVARRYRVSSEALKPIFAAAQSSGHELGLDPLLIVAVIGVESGFNPLSQSVVGAQGLMQVMPRFHSDKLPEDVGELPFFDPVTNVQVGAQVLKESIRRYGGLETGLQQFGGALGDPERRYANKVMAERQRLEQAIQRVRKA